MPWASRARQAVEAAEASMLGGALQATGGDTARLRRRCCQPKLTMRASCAAVLQPLWAGRVHGRDYMVVGRLKQAYHSRVRGCRRRTGAQVGREVLGCLEDIWNSRCSDRMWCTVKAFTGFEQPAPTGQATWLHARSRHRAELPFVGTGNPVYYQLMVRLRVGTPSRCAGAVSRMYVPHPTAAATLPLPPWCASTCPG